MVSHFINLKRPCWSVFVGEFGLYFGRWGLLVHIHLGHFDKIFGLGLDATRRVRWLVDPVIVLGNSFTEGFERKFRN